MVSRNDVPNKPHHAEIKRIMMPNGVFRTFYCDEGQTWAEVIENVVLPEASDYCYQNWISPNHEDMFCAEKRVKSFLDRCAYLITKDGGSAYGIESEYKAMSHKVREIPVSECPPEISDMFYADRKAPVDDEDSDARYQTLTERLVETAKAKNVRSSSALPKRSKIGSSRFERMTEIDRSFPGNTKTWCVVDADNYFEYRGKRYKIPRDMHGYYSTGNGIGSMDRLLVVETEDALRFYDQNVENVFYVANR
jgi:hypothetical protein